MAKIVIALGGNALGSTVEQQLERSQYAAKAIADLILADNSIVIAHGNGPQVGQIRLAFENGYNAGTVPFVPFAECTAMSQGYIGYHLQQSIDEELVSRGHTDIPVIAMLTQVVVSETDLAFANPTKPVGGYYDEQTARRLMQETGNKYVEDSGRGWRRVVPSPKPLDIYEKASLKTLVDAKQVVIACGGGGIPVVYRGTRYMGIDAVIDKDFAAAKMADLIEADLFIILTAVEFVCINFGKENCEQLKEMSLSLATRYINEGQFAKGSMLPKVQAAVEFVAGKAGRRAVIASLDCASAALVGESGTVIYNDNDSLN